MSKLLSSDIWWFPHANPVCTLLFNRVTDTPYVRAWPKGGMGKVAGMLIGGVDNSSRKRITNGQAR